MDTELACSIGRRRARCCARPSEPSSIEQELRHQEHRDALRTGRRGRSASQHEVDDVLGAVVLAQVMKISCPVMRSASAPGLSDASDCRLRPCWWTAPTIRSSACGSVRFVGT